MKKILSVILVLLLAISIISCTAEENIDTDTDASEVTTSSNTTEVTDSETEETEEEIKENKKEFVTKENDESKWGPSIPIN